MSYPISDALQAIVAVADITGDELAEAAKKAASAVLRRVAIWKTQRTPEPVIRCQLRRFAKRHHIEQPGKPGLEQMLNRFCDAAWWRRALRKRFRSVELAAIQAGQVHAKAGKYVSAKAMHRYARDKRRIAELLASLVAVNRSTGEMLPLDELAAQSLANPAHRRRAMMARIKGIEQYANAKGDVGVFLTITCPSRMHARHITGAANERYDGTGPRAAHAHLCRVWRDAGRKLGHLGVNLYGLRVVEPHHDACPHWHVLGFVKPEHEETVIQTMREYALRDSPNEPGAAERRFKVERIDPSKGSATGYVAKYVSKSIDGEGVEIDDETGASGKDAAMGVVAWARVFGIRQFQFFGVPAITPSRELFRLPSMNVPSRGLVLAHQATKANDYGTFLNVFDAFALNFRTTYSERDSTRYPAETAHRILGLIAKASDLVMPAEFTTRVDEWRIQPRKDEAASAVPAPPWTRFNNCAPIDLKDFFADSIEVEDLASSKGGMGGKKSAPRRAPLPNAGRVDWRSNRPEHSGITESRKNMTARASHGGQHA